MAVFNTKLDNVGFAIEGTVGTKETTADIWYERISGHIYDHVETEVTHSAGGRLSSANHNTVLKEWAEGDFVGLVEHMNHGFILNAVFGDAPTPAQVETTAYDHTFTPLQSTVVHQSLSIFGKNANKTYVMPYGMINNYSVNFSRDEVLRFTANFTAKKSETDASETPAYTAQSIFSPAHFAFYIEDEVSDLAAATAVPIQDASLTIEKEVQVEYNAGQPSVIVANGFKVTGSVTLLQQNDTYHDLVLGGTPKALRFQYKNTDVTIGATSNPEISYDLYRVGFTGYTENRTLAELAGQTLEFEALYYKADSEIMKCRIRNTRSTAYDA
jgi:hypothetical protein